jgi:hypothetical protein
MKINVRKTIIDRIDDAIEAADGIVQNIELDREERHELYKFGSASGRFKKRTNRYWPAMTSACRGYFATRSGVWIDVLAQEETE